jgi:hypothetical protein
MKKVCNHSPKGIAYLLNPFFVISLMISINLTGCKKLVEVNSPVTSTPESLVFNSDATAAAVLTGIYTNLSGALNIRSIGLGPASLSFFGGLSADELKLHSGITGTSLFYYQNSLGSANIGSGYWESIYPRIFITNSAIEGLTASKSLTPDIMKQLLGEAKFMRAFFYFYLVNLYGDVPLILSTNYLANAPMPRSPKSEVWNQITTDLNDAEKLLSSDFLKADAFGVTTERLRPTKWAASALLSRVYLYQGKWSEAENAATNDISNVTLFDTVALNNNVFGKTSKEAIWQLQPVNTGWNTEDARTFIIPASGPSGSFPVYLSNFLLNSFENGDNRKNIWVKTATVRGNTYYYPFKYTSASFNAPVNEYRMVLRLGEVYLNRSEARAQNGNVSGAVADLNIIRKRAKLPDYSGPTDKASLLAAILHERQIELFTEWGHRWLDLKRTGTVDAVMSLVTAQKGGSWNTNWQWYPISQTELQRNPYLLQNEGY